jgi:hypothetical protein
MGLSMLTESGNIFVSLLIDPEDEADFTEERFEEWFEDVLD